jgi:hypothetical protein
MDFEDKIKVKVSAIGYPHLGYQKKGMYKASTWYIGRVFRNHNKFN